MKTLLLLLTPLFPAAATAAGPTETNTAHRYLIHTIAEYSEAHSECEDARAVVPEVSEDALRALSNYPEQDARLYLMARSHQLVDECAQEALADLAIALNTLDGAEIEGRTQQAMTAVRELVFSPVRWEFKKRYLELPDNMKAHLNSYPEFQRPFDSLPVRELLEEKVGG